MKYLRDPFIFFSKERFLRFLFSLRHPAMTTTTPQSRRLTAIKLVQSGLTYDEVGRRMGGISRQRVCQLVNKVHVDPDRAGNGRRKTKA